MKKISILLFLTIVLFSACEEPEDTIKEEPEQEQDNRLGTYTGTGNLIYYDLYGAIEYSYKNLNVTVKVSNSWSDNDFYNVYVDYPGKGIINVQVKKKDFSILEDKYDGFRGSIIISSLKCSGNVSSYNSTTKLKSSSYSWSSSK